MRIGIDIDDTTFSTMEQMIKYADIFEFEIKGKNGIKAILMTTKLNQKMVDGDVIRANDWLGIYEIINEKFKE